MADEVFGAFGVLDVLVNNVGDVSSEHKSWRDLTQERSMPSSMST